MNILLVCGNGITTNMLAAKLQNYAREQDKKDYFSACRIGQYDELLPHSDVVLIAPQAALMAAELRQKAEALQIPCQQLTEETFVLGKLDLIYSYIDSVRTCAPPRPEPLKLTLPLTGRIFLHALLSALPVLLFGLLCRLAGRLFSSQFLIEASSATGSLWILYLMFSVGYHYGALTNRDPIPRGMIALGAPLLMMPIGGLYESWSTSFRVALGLIPISFFTSYSALLLICISVLSVWVVYGLDRIPLPVSFRTFPLMENMLKMGTVTLLVILLRCLFMSL